MDSETGKEMTLIKAQKIIAASDDFYVGGAVPEIAIALVKIITAIKVDGYQLIKLDKLLDGINKKAIEGISMDADKADIYMACLEDLAALIKDCLNDRGKNDSK